jgi:hypothetical protein
VPAIVYDGRIAATHRRNTGDGEHSEIVIGERVYPVQTADLG